MCPTHWVERHDSALVFIELIKPVLDCLETISEWPDMESSSGANQLLSSLTQPEFLISMHVVAKIFAANLGLCRFLQKENIDLVQALALADSILAILEDMRANAMCVYADLFAAVATLCSDIHVEFVKPRLCKRQLDYYVRNVISRLTITRPLPRQDGRVSRSRSQSRRVVTQ